eukprot:13070628-Alexandrium_andersonii.AAC.1
MARWEGPGVNADLIDRHLQFVNLHWEDGRASCAPLLDGFNWDTLCPDGVSLGCGSVTTDA